MREKILLSWSGGKDSALTLYELQRNGTYEVVALLTTVIETDHSISMHGVPGALLAAQAAALGLPLVTVEIPKFPANEIYEARMRDTLTRFQAEGVRRVAFGDIFLADLRTYREEKLALLGMEGLFPLWQRNTQELMETFCALGFEAIVTCIDPKVLTPTLVGRRLDAAFVAALPPTADPCGENGEFHSFVYAGPIFRQPVPVQTGATWERDGFWYAEIGLRVED
ncbi:MAG: diphthine--ammonia ligase [Blastocatellia bacterium]|nr:diphthine--ammonia ligase [Blastocatellia bacterium]